MNFSSRAFPCGRACRNEDGESTGAIKGAPCYTGFNYADSKPIHFCHLITFEAIIVKSKRRRSVFPNKVWKRKSPCKNSNCVWGNVQKTTNWPFQRPPTSHRLDLLLFQMFCVHLRHKTSVQQRGCRGEDRGRAIIRNSQRAPTTVPLN